MKSIWDVRFTKKKLAMDAAVKNAFVALDEWITVHPNGPDNVGRHIELDESGRIINGMGGSHNGEKLSEIGIKSAFPKEYHGEETNPDNIDNPHFVNRVWGYNREIKENEGNARLRKMSAEQLEKAIDDPKSAKELIDSCSQKQLEDLEEEYRKERLDALLAPRPNVEESERLRRLMKEYDDRRGAVRKLMQWKKDGLSAEGISKELKNEKQAKADREKKEWQDYWNRYEEKYGPYIPDDDNSSAIFSNYD